MSSSNLPHLLEDVLVNPSKTNAAPSTSEDDRPPVCPRCQKRLVILATHSAATGEGRPHRRQLWGCPKGHATVYRIGGIFSGVEVLPDFTT